MLAQKRGGTDMIRNCLDKNAQRPAVTAKDKGTAAVFDIGVVHLHQAVAARSHGQPGQVVVGVVGADQREDPVNRKVSADFVQAVRVPIPGETKELAHPVRAEGVGVIEPEQVAHAGQKAETAPEVNAPVRCGIGEEPVDLFCGLLL